MPDSASPADLGARAAVLARLWGALAREPIPGLGTRETTGDTLAVKLPDGRSLRGSVHAAKPFAVAPAGFALDLDGVDHTDPARLLRELWLPCPTDRLEAELDNSVANLALARAGQPHPQGGEPALRRATAEPDPLAYLEQCVVDGHPLHPCCRTRMGLSPGEVLAYAPEHRPVVELGLIRVRADRWLGVGCPPELPVHPWQRDHVLDAYPWLRETGEIIPTRPLMSLRTVARIDAPDEHLKTAVDVQMTSAVRTVSPAAIRNGPAISALLLSLAARTPTLSILPEVGAGAALVDGEPCRSLGVVHRRMPALAPGEVALPMAAFAAPSPADGRPIVAEVVNAGFGGDALEFVDHLAALVLPPLLTLLNLGIALEAHGQNLLVVIRNARPVRLLYRDMGGLRVSPAGLRRHGIEAPPLHGDVATDDPEVLRTKLFASAVSTVVGEVVSVLRREFGADEEKAWHRVAAAVRRHDEPDTTALFADTLPIKATTAMRLAPDPLEDVWTRLPNPMAGLQ